MSKEDLQSRIVYFWGGAPVHDLLLTVPIDRIIDALGSERIYHSEKEFHLPPGTCFEIKPNENDTFYFNPAATSKYVESKDTNVVIGFGDKVSQSGEHIMFSREKELIERNLQEIIKNKNKSTGAKITENGIGVKWITIGTKGDKEDRPKSLIGGNNYNIFRAMYHLLKNYDLPDKSKQLKNISFLHLFPYDSRHPFWRRVLDDYGGCGIDGNLAINCLPKEYVDIEGLSPRESVVFTLVDKNRDKMNRSIFTTLSRETDLVTEENLHKRYNKIKELLSDNGIHIINTITHPSELIEISLLIESLFQYNRRSVVFCPSKSFINTADKLVGDGEGYWDKDSMSYYKSGVKWIQDKLIKFVSLLINNEDELYDLFPHYKEQNLGLESTANKVRRSVGLDEYLMRTFGDLIVTSGNRGVSLVTEPEDKDPKEALDQIYIPYGGSIKMGEDILINPDITLAAGDTFTGINNAFGFIGYSKIDALYGAALGTQYFIRTGELPTIDDIIDQSIKHKRGTKGDFRTKIFLNRISGGRIDPYKKTDGIEPKGKIDAPDFGDLVKSYHEGYKEGSIEDTTFTMKDYVRQ